MSKKTLRGREMDRLRTDARTDPLAKVGGPCPPAIEGGATRGGGASSSSSAPAAGSPGASASAAAGARRFEQRTNAIVARPSAGSGLVMRTRNTPVPGSAAAGSLPLPLPLPVACSSRAARASASSTGTEEASRGAAIGWLQTQHRVRCERSDTGVSGCGKAIVWTKTEVTENRVGLHQPTADFRSRRLDEKKKENKKKKKKIKRHTLVSGELRLGVVAGERRRVRLPARAVARGAARMREPEPQLLARPQSACTQQEK